jgi:hypothetical protein
MAMSDYRVDGTIGESSWFIAGRARNFLLESVQTSCGAYATPCSGVPGVPSQVRNADHLLVVPCLRISGFILLLICFHDAVLNKG